MLEPSIRCLAALACGRREPLSGPDRPAGDELLRLASRLGLVSLLADALADTGHPEARRAVASGLMLTARRQRLFALLRLLLDNRAVGDPVLVKGGALVIAELLEHRDMVDLDVVVSRSAVQSWREAAARAGGTWRDGLGYEAGSIMHPDGMIEVHTALPGFVGNESGPAHETLGAQSTPSPLSGVRVPSPQAAREITVQHFAFHHFGETGHALRVLQDLAALEGSPEGEGLDWGRSGVKEATTRLREIVRQVRDGRDREEPASDYLSALAGAIEVDAHATFAEDVERWIGDKAGVAGKAGLIARRLFPPVEQMRESADEPFLRTLSRYAARPFRMAAKLVATRRPKSTAAARWDATIAALKE